MSTASLQLTSDHTAAAATASATTGVMAVVAPYGTGSHYQAEVAATGWGCVAVTTPEEQLPPMYRGHLDESGYRQVVVHNGDLQATARTLASLGVTAIVAGTEIGVPLAEILAHRLGLPGNDPRTSDLRRDKGAMAAALKQVGLDAPRSLSTDRLRDALAWAAQQEDCDEFVLKPADSGGSDGVFFCTSPDDITAAWHHLHGIPNALGGDNGHLILQERLRGMQHVVNSVSAVDAGGTPRHTFTEIWADHRIGHVYDRLDLRRPNRLVPKLLADYTARVLDVLGITTGPAHTEVMYARRRGPVLIETGNRPEGSYPVLAMRKATGSDHIRDAVHAAITGRPERLSHPDPNTFVTKVSLISPGDGAFDEERLQQLLDLPTVRGHVGALTTGTRVTRTVDLLTSPGRLLLASDDAHAITKDHAAIRQLEKDGLYSGDPR
ncbi:hypothetical protein ACIP5U_38600 [Streptomyces sp. NPDC088788]|uniref:hypothetical protein n=1 Tax=Streptomyces sp. NPDC088788 TaxID=3365898 RepID=UPI00382A8BB8